MRFRPCIDLHNGKVKQIVGSTLKDTGTGVVTNFETDLPSSWFADLYRKDDVPGGHVIMLGPGNEQAAREALSAFPGGLQVGGGIKPDNAGMYLDAGASHVIVTSFVFQAGVINWDNLNAMVGSVGKSRLVLDLSCKKKDGSYYIVTDRWQNFTNEVIGKEIFSVLGEYCDEFLIHAADVEGKRGGIDEELVSLLHGCSEKPITYAGGIRSIEDLALVNKLGAGTLDVTIGSALDIFGGVLKYDDVVKYCRNAHR